MTSEKTEASGDKAASAEPQMSRPPSVMWLVIPLLLLMIYAALR